MDPPEVPAEKPDLAKVYPGSYSCAIQVVNFLGRRMTDGQSVIEGSHETVPRFIRFAQTIGIWRLRTDRRLLAILSYKIGAVRVAFEILIDKSMSGNKTQFRLGFVPCEEPGRKLRKILKGINSWNETNWGSAQDGTVTATRGNIILTGKLTRGEKCVFEIVINKVA